MATLATAAATQTATRLLSPEQLSRAAYTHSLNRPFHRLSFKHQVYATQCVLQHWFDDVLDQNRIPVFGIMDDAAVAAYKSKLQRGLLCRLKEEVEQKADLDASVTVELEVKEVHKWSGFIKIEEVVRVHVRPQGHAELAEFLSTHLTDRRDSRKRVLRSPEESGEVGREIMDGGWPSCWHQEYLGVCVAVVWNEAAREKVVEKSIEEAVALLSKCWPPCIVTRIVSPLCEHVM